MMAKLSGTGGSRRNLLSRQSSRRSQDGSPARNLLTQGGSELRKGSSRGLMENLNSISSSRDGTPESIVVVSDINGSNHSHLSLGSSMNSLNSFHGLNNSKRNIVDRQVSDLTKDTQKSSPSLKSSRSNRSQRSLSSKKSRPKRSHRSHLEGLNLKEGQGDAGQGKSERKNAGISRNRPLPRFSSRDLFKQQGESIIANVQKEREKVNARPDLRADPSLRPAHENVAFFAGRENLSQPFVPPQRRPSVDNSVSTLGSQSATSRRRPSEISIGSRRPSIGMESIIELKEDVDSGEEYQFDMEAVHQTQRRSSRNSNQFDMEAVHQTQRRSSRNSNQFDMEAVHQNQRRSSMNSKSPKSTRSGRHERRPSNFSIDFLQQQGTSDITMHPFVPESISQLRAPSETSSVYHERNNSNEFSKHLRSERTLVKNRNSITSLTVTNHQEPKQGLAAWIPGQAVKPTLNPSEQYYKRRQSNEFEEPRIALGNQEFLDSQRFPQHKQPIETPSELREALFEPVREESVRMGKKRNSLRNLFAHISSRSCDNDNDSQASMSNGSPNIGAIDLTSSMLQKHQQKKKKNRMSIREALSNPRASYIWQDDGGDDDASYAFSNFKKRRLNKNVIIIIVVVLVLSLSLGIALGTGQKKNKKNGSLGQSWNATLRQNHTSKAPSPTLAATIKPTLKLQIEFSAGSPSETSTSQKKVASNEDNDLKFNVDGKSGEKQRKRTATPIISTTKQPTQVTSSPSKKPFAKPTLSPSSKVTPSPTLLSTIKPSAIASSEPSTTPTKLSSLEPTASSSVEPSITPTSQPIIFPSLQPTIFISQNPTVVSSVQPSISHQPTPIIWNQLGNTIYGSRASEQFGENTAISVLTEDQIRIAVATSLNEYQYDPFPLNFEDAIYGGIVQVYELRNKSEWVPLGDIFSGEANFGLGYSMAFSKDGMTLALGSKGDRAALIPSFTSIYRFWKEEWHLVGNFASPDTSSISSMTTNLSFNGKRILVATAKYGEKGGEIIEIAIFDFVQNNLWSQVGDSVVFDANPFTVTDRQRVRTKTQEIRLSTDMSSDGSRFVMGIYGKDFSFVRMYEFDQRSNKWFQLMGAIPCKPSAVALSGDGTVFAIGIATATEKKGQVRVYMVKGQNRWFQYGNFIQQPDREYPKASSLCASYSDAFGHTVSLSKEGTRIAVGAPGRCDSLSDDNEPNGGLHGEVFTYQYDQSSSSWSLLEGNENEADRLTGEGEGDLYGYSVSISEKGETMVVGAISNDGGGFNSGNIHVYTRK